DIPAEQITRVDPQIIATYAGTKGVTPGSVLAYILGLGDNPQNGQTATGTDGNIYVATNGVFVLTPRLQGVGGRKF
ncbi:MAG TPA: hypothetical protein VG297_24280, partial [Bryobacteraceae bacterium]|nr:hypothetical protein [Bryobacteraceae bacterium]